MAATNRDDDELTMNTPPPDAVPSADEVAGEKPSSPPTKLLTKDDIRTGMNVAQTVYAVVMTLGLKVAVEALYPAIFARGTSGVGTLSPVLIGIAFITILMLAMRFFWVTRNLYAYALHHIRAKKAAKKIFRPLMLYHFPVALLHSILFFGICEAFAEMTESTQPMHAPVIHFIGICITLLLLNAIWLSFITPRDDSGPGRRVWARNNGLFAVMVGLVLVAFFVLDFSSVALLLAACGLFVANSIIDLHQAASSYILFET